MGARLGELGSPRVGPQRGPSPTAKNLRPTSPFSQPTAPPSAPRRSRPTGSPTHPTASDAQAGLASVWAGGVGVGAGCPVRPLRLRWLRVTVVSQTWEPVQYVYSRRGCGWFVWLNIHKHFQILLFGVMCVNQVCLPSTASHHNCQILQHSVGQLT